MRAFVAICVMALLPVTRAAELSPAQQSAARKLYVLKCAKCHEFYEPAEYSEAGWTRWMQKMKKKAHLKKADYDLLLKYTQQLRNTGKRSVSGSKGN